MKRPEWYIRKSKKYIAKIINVCYNFIRCKHHYIIKNENHFDFSKDDFWYIVIECQKCGKFKFIAGNKKIVKQMNLDEKENKKWINW